LASAIADIRKSHLVSLPTRNAIKQIRDLRGTGIPTRFTSDPLCAIALAAGELIMTHYRAGVERRLKEDRSPVTVADVQAEDLILTHLSALHPGVPIISEERAAAGDMPETGAEFFLVDPLDGTKEFLSRNGEFTVNIAMIKDGLPIAGVVYAPAMGRAFWSNGAGEAWECTPANSSPAKRLHTRTPPSDGMIAVASRSHRDTDTDAILSKYQIKQILTAGSSVKFCLIAAGEADIYPRHGRTIEWDTAAGHAVLLAAGGRVTHLDGATPLRYGKRADGYANPHFIAWGK
jgi:3'(2'), 5'-bisphosphate nucleotidase